MPDNNDELLRRSQKTAGNATLEDIGRRVGVTNEMFVNDADNLKSEHVPDGQYFGATMG